MTSTTKGLEEEIGFGIQGLNIFGGGSSSNNNNNNNNNRGLGGGGGGGGSVVVGNVGLRDPSSSSTSTSSSLNYQEQRRELPLQDNAFSQWKGETIENVDNVAGSSNVGFSGSGSIVSGEKQLLVGGGGGGGDVRGLNVSGVLSANLPPPPGWNTNNNQQQHQLPHQPQNLLQQNEFLQRQQQLQYQQQYPYPSINKTSEYPNKTEEC